MKLKKILLVYFLIYIQLSLCACSPVFYIFLPGAIKHMINGNAVTYSALPFFVGAIIAIPVILVIWLLLRPLHPVLSWFASVASGLSVYFVIYWQYRLIPDPGDPAACELNWENCSWDSFALIAEMIVVVNLALLIPLIGWGLIYLLEYFMGYIPKQPVYRKYN